MVLIVAIAVSSAVLFISWLWFTCDKLNRQLKGFPNPPRLLFFGNALDFKSTTDFIPKFATYKKLYGSAVKLYIGIKFSKLIIFDKKFIEFVLFNSKILDKGQDYQYLANWLGSGLLISNGDNVWKHHRKVIAPSFNKQVYDDFIEVFETNAQILIQKLSSELGNSSFDIYPFIRLCSLDIICEAAMGTSIDAQENADSDYVESVKIMCQKLLIRSFHPILTFYIAYRFSKYYQKEIKAIEILSNHTNTVIEKRRQYFLKQVRGDAEKPEDKRRLAFLDLLLQESEINKTLSNSDIKEEVETFMFAGHDTSASALSFTIFCLAQNPHVQDKVMEELFEIFSGDILRSITLQDVNQMRYLEAVIKESLRLFPPVPYIGRQVREDVIYDGHTLPKGLSMLLDIFGLHRDPEIFTEPDRFIPERFLEEGEGRRLPYVYIPFSVGPRSCIGQKFAMLEMKAVLSVLLRRYQFLPSVPQHDLLLATEVTLQSKNGIRIQIVERMHEL